MTGTAEPAVEVSDNQFTVVGGSAIARADIDEGKEDHRHCTSPTMNQVMSEVRFIILYVAEITPELFALHDLLAKLNNLTSITWVILLGFQGGSHLQRALFTIFLVAYCVTICGNFLIISLVFTCKTLHTPMYFLLSQLSISDIVLSSDIVPNMLSLLLHPPGTMSFPSCIAQLYFFILAELYECFLLTVMSYDRYVAICNPLKYHIVMTPIFCLQLALLMWLLNIIVSLLDLQLLYRLWFCGPNVIDHFFCDMQPLLDLSCSDTSMSQLEMTILCIPVLIFPFGFIVTSYCFIINSILGIATSSGRQKAFSTCSSHLTVVSIFYGTIFFNYAFATRGYLWNISKLISLLYTVGTPLMNPIIYSLRNKDIKTALQKSVQSFYLK
ncbi:olfactory receptor 6B9-like [Gastrophryne carolinensis]